jgi:hypothetical protein
MKRLVPLVYVGVSALVLGGAVQPAWAAVPANDLISGATTISALPYTDSSSTSEATSTGEPTDCMASPAIWYSFRPATTVAVLADTIGSGFDTRLAVYVGRVGVRSTAIACNDDSGGWGTSETALYLSPKYTYFFMVGGFGSNTGSTTFSLTQQTTVPVETVALSAAATSTGEAAVTGSLWCDANTSGTLTSLYLFQVRRDGTEVGGWTGLSVACGSTFTATVIPYTQGSFQRGPVQASLSGSYYTADFPELFMDDYQSLRMGAAR